MNTVVSNTVGNGTSGGSTPPVAAALAIQTQPGSATSGVPFAIQSVVRIVDGAGSVVSTSTASGDGGDCERHGLAHGDDDGERGERRGLIHQPRHHRFGQFFAQVHVRNASSCNLERLCRLGSRWSLRPRS